MKEIKLFYLTHCPYCHNARRAIEELIRDNPAYGDICVVWSEESEKPELAEQYDYYYVPSVFFAGEKLYEAHPSESYEDCRKNMKAAFDAVLKK